MGYRLGIIGAGNMGQAIVRGSIARRLLASQEVLVVEIDPARRREVAQLGCATDGEASSAAGCGEILLAVKPQSFPAVAASLGPLPEPKVIISIMAGLSSRGIRDALGDCARVVRVMPNTPCRVGAGMAAICLGAGARPGDEALATALFGALGKTTTVDEAMMHAVTATSGSGPAYVFLLAEAMETAAVRLGLDAVTARLLARQTVLGAGKLLCESDLEAADLRGTVTSPGGTTEAAVAVMLKRGLPEVICDAITAARDRGRELEEEGFGVRGSG